MTEADLLSSVRELAGILGLLTYHTHDSRRSEAGFPDLFIAGTSGVLFAELKSMTGKLTHEQTVWKWRLQAAGQPWVLWRPTDWYSGIIETRLKEIA
jgi:hypothetical protein